jgi:hypothetical protein
MNREWVSAPFDLIQVEGRHPVNKEKDKEHQYQDKNQKHTDDVLPGQERGQAQKAGQGSQQGQQGQGKGSQSGSGGKPQNR